MKRLLLLCVVALASCAHEAHGAAATTTADCPSSKPALGVMDKFLAAFNAKDMKALEATFHFPHMRLASYPIQVLTGPGQQDDVFAHLAEEGWAKSGWEKLSIIQCSAAKAHIVATFARFHADGSEYSHYDGLYVVELRDGFWGITARSTFAP
ncbi:MAG TPA: hypothetical protein VGO52_02875 [Hyphomonadaceae bacterium]|jgi:hypothetical protein|nr:hypothetical protein [Hyphomonadaceae bacterium]